MTSLGNVKFRTLRDVAYESIKESIMKHELMPGESVTITHLSTKLGISPTPVREAVVRLSNEGILDYEANKRIKVSQIDRQDVSAVYEARRLLEVYIAKKFVNRSGVHKDIKRRLSSLKKETEGLIHKKKPADHYAVVDLKLHEFFLDMVENEIIKELFYILGNKSLRIRTFVEAVNKDKKISETSLQNSAREHLRIIEALISGEEGDVTAAVAHHLLNSEERTLKKLDAYFQSI